jgi:hypothetical protein
MLPFLAVYLLYLIKPFSDELNAKPDFTDWLIWFIILFYATIFYTIYRWFAQDWLIQVRSSFPKEENRKRVLAMFKRRHYEIYAEEEDYVVAVYKCYNPDTITVIFADKLVYFVVSKDSTKAGFFGESAKGGILPVLFFHHFLRSDLKWVLSKDFRPTE